MNPLDMLAGFSLAVVFLEMHPPVFQTFSLFPDGHSPALRCGLCEVVSSALPVDSEFY